MATKMKTFSASSVAVTVAELRVAVESNMENCTVPAYLKAIHGKPDDYILYVLEADLEGLLTKQTTEDREKNGVITRHVIPMRAGKPPEPPIIVKP